MKHVIDGVITAIVLAAINGNIASITSAVQIGRAHV